MPQRELFGDGQRVGGTRRRQCKRRVARLRPRALRARGRLAVEANGAQTAGDAPYPVNFTLLRVADRGVQAAAPLACDDRVPDGDTMRLDARESLPVRQLRERLVQHVAKDRPEMVARMR